MDNDTVTLVVESQHYDFSKEKLSKYSGYFTAMFNSDFAEKKKSVIKLEEVSVTSWEHILYFLNHGKIRRSLGETLVEEMLSLLQAATMFQFIEVQGPQKFNRTEYTEYSRLVNRGKATQACAPRAAIDLKSCTKILFDALNVSNAIRVLEIASRLDSTNLIHKARAIALWNFDEVTKLEVYFNLNVDQVEGYISDTALHSWTGEWGVWEAIDRWLNSTEDLAQTRSQHLPRLIKCLHLDSLSLSDLRCMALYESVQNCPVVSMSIREIIKERISGPKGRETDVNEKSTEEEVSKFIKNWRKTEPRKLPLVPYRIVQWCVSMSIREIIKERISGPKGRETDVNEKSTEEEVSKFIKNWRKTEPRKLPLVPTVVGNIHTDANSTSPCIFKFCEIEKKFIPVLRLNKVENSLGSMVGFKVIANESALYLLGGEMMTRQSAWNHSVWMYDQIHKSWTFLSNLLRPSRHLSACCVGDDLYVIGGFGRHRVVQDTVCKLNLRDRIWTTCAPLPRPVYSVPCCVFRNHIYVIESVIYQYIPSRDKWITLNISPTAKGFANAMANDEFIFLTEAYTRNVFKFNPSESSSRLELLGTFKNECVQACLIDEHIYSLSQDEFGDEMYCERLNVRTGESTVLWEGTTDGRIADLSPKHRHGCFPFLLY